MSAITIREKIESETIYLPELKPLIGKTVQITVREEPIAASTTADWDIALQAGRELENYDFDAMRQQREYDRIHARDHVP